MKRYVILKGLEGFGDRLQCLLQAMAYADATQRYLVVDWRDKDWSHHHLQGFESYFKLDGIKTEPIDEFLLNHSIVCKSTVFPGEWSSKLGDLNYHSFIRDDCYKLPGDGASIDEIVKGVREDFVEPIVVYPGVGARTYRYSDSRCICLNSETLAKIKQMIGLLGLNNFESYDIVHLRGGSKAWAGGELRPDSPVFKLHNKWYSSEQYMQEIYDVFCFVKSKLEPRPLFILSDTPRLADEWIHKYGIGCRIPTVRPDMSRECGIHKLNHSDLESCGLLTKDCLNLECIRDFILMQRSRILVGDDVSLFSLMAFGLKLSKVDWLEPNIVRTYLM